MREQTGPAGPAVENLVVTVGGSPVPVLLALAALRPAHVVALVTQASHPVWDRVVAAAGTLVGWSGTTEAVTVVNHDPTSTATSLEHLEDAGMREWSLAYAGGTPTMSAVAFARWQAGPGAVVQSSSVQPRAWYVAEAGDVLVSHDDVVLHQSDALTSASIPLADMVVLHGLHPDRFEAAPEQWQPVPGDDDPAVLSAALDELPVYGASAERDSLDARLVDVVARAVARVAADQPATRVYRPVKASRADGREFDGRTRGIVAVTGLSVRLLSVAGYARSSPDKPLVLRRMPVGDLKEQLFTAYDVARGLGGLHARAAVLGTDTSPSAHDEVRTIWADIGPLSQPDDLPHPDSDDPPWPPMTAFAWSDLVEAVQAADRPADLRDTDLYRWLTEV
jgi:hypothetical protein